MLPRRGAFGAAPFLWTFLLAVASGAMRWRPEKVARSAHCCRGRAVAVFVAAHCFWGAAASRHPLKQQSLLEASSADAHERRKLGAIAHQAIKASLKGKELPILHLNNDPHPFFEHLLPDDDWNRPQRAEVRSGVYEPPLDLPKVNNSLASGLGKWLPPAAANLLLNIGSGTGAAPGSTGDLLLDQELMRRMRFQDKVVMLLLLAAYAGSLAFSATLAYRQSLNSSPVNYYADPRYYTQVIETHDLEDFLDAFNHPPKDVQLQITGFVPLPPLHESFVDAAVDWLGSRYRVAFSFALDLSPWVVHDDREPATGIGSGAGVSTEDLERLRDFLEHDTNDLAAVQIRKEVHWSDWEELATNIKHQIRQGGFNGIIHVCCAEDEIMTVYKNKPWANFMHRRATKVLCALSIVGWFVYQPYMWFRHRALVVTSRYRVDVAIRNYWPLIADKVGPEGFSSS